MLLLKLLVDELALLRYCTYKRFDVRILGQVDARDDRVEQFKILAKSQSAHVPRKLLLRISVKVLI